MLRWIAILVFTSFLVSACTSTELGKVSLGGEYFEIDSQFSGLYTSLGGMELFGPGISPKFSHQGLEYQYTAATLFVYNPALSGGNQISLAPIGMELGVADNNPGEEMPSTLKIYPGFQDFYSSLGGSRVVGLPITNVHYNSETGRLEQYFENLGFYQLDSDSAQDVHLLHYGAWMCSARCDYSSSKNSIVNLNRSNAAPFLDVINKLDPNFIGRPITKPYIAPDGKIQQIFQNVVLVTSPFDSNQFNFRPIPEMLGILGSPGSVFEIPPHFQDYIDNAIGAELAGPAVSAYTQQSQSMFRQCFQSFCLNYFPENSTQERITPVPLGYLYRQKYFREAETFVPEIQTEFQEYTITVWEDAPIVKPDTPQTVGVSIVQSGVPVNGLRAFLYLKFPENIKIKYLFPKTQDNGTSTLILNPIDAPHGTVISYDVCVDPVVTDRSCVNESFLIWGNP